ncbi:MAG: DUF5060 domain-containing protein [bacterium]
MTQILRRNLIIGLVIFTLSVVSLPLAPNVYAEKGQLSPEITSVTPVDTKIGRYEKFEVEVDFKASYDDPYDPDDIMLSAVFTSPSGKEFNVLGFLYSGKVSGKGVSDAVWKIRFAPDEEGRWHYIVSVRNEYGEKQYKQKTFKCKVSSSKGHLRIGKADPRYFEFDNGEFYYAVGHNVCWASPVDYRYKKYFADMGQNSENWSRVWMPSWGVALEWKKGEGLYEGLGIYNLKNAENIDIIMDEARKNEIYLQLVLINHGQLSKEINAEWKDNPYNSRNGGPCKQPEEFFTNPQAKKLFKNRLRYIIARWGYSTNIMAWEFFNEVDLTNNYNEENIRDWHNEMAEFTRAIDPFDHLLTTSFARKVGYTIWELPLMDFMQVHIYSSDIVEETVHWVNDLAGKFNKPVFVAECGNDAQNGVMERRQDPYGIHLHNAIWAALASPGAGTGMYWWWDTYIKDLYLYHHFKILASFMGQGDLRGLGLKQSDVRVEQATGDLVSLSLVPLVDWERSTQASFKIDTKGKISSFEGLSRFIQGRAHKDMKVSPNFEVNYPFDGTFTVNVSMVSESDANISLYLDGKLKLDEKINYPEDGKHTIRSYNINVPAGKHVVKIANNGKDWFRIRDIVLSNYTLPVIANGVQGTTFGMFWFLDRRNTADNYKMGIEALPVEGVKAILEGFAEGEYVVEYYNTYRGEILKQDRIEAKEGRLVLMLPTFTGDIACKVRLAESKKK